MLAFNELVTLRARREVHANQHNSSSNDAFMTDLSRTEIRWIKASGNAADAKEHLPRSFILSFQNWWRRRELNSDPRVTPKNSTCLVTSLLCPKLIRQKFARRRVSEVTNLTRASPALVSREPTDRRFAPAYLRDISLRAHKQLA